MSDAEAREGFGMRFSGDLAGVLFPYVDPETGRRVSARLRRDHPEVDQGGKPLHKYVSAYGDRRHLYFPPESAELLRDFSAPVVIVEAEKAALALMALARRAPRRLLTISVGGCYGWRGTMGIGHGPNGGRLIVKGPLPDLDRISWTERESIIFFDSNAATNPAVRKARMALAEELAARGARVRIADVPVLPGVNGPDDLIATSGDEAILAVLDRAKAFSQCAVSEAEAAIAEVETDKSSDPLPAIEAIAVVEDSMRCSLLIGRLVKLRISGLNKQLIEHRIELCRSESRQARKDAAETARRGRLLGMDLAPAKLLSEVAAFFSERAWLPPHAAIVMAVFTMLSYCLEFFSTTPYLCFESATPGCGKTTCLQLLASVIARALFSVGLSRAVLVRQLDQRSVTLLLDESEWLTGNDETAQTLKRILHSGYRRGATCQCCEGDDHELREFQVFGAKAFAAIGGLAGALLDRCIVIHLERAPVDTILVSSAVEDTESAAAPLRERLEAFALQSAPSLENFRRNRPAGGYWPEFRNREAELWHPLLTIGRACGLKVEQCVLEAARTLSRAKQAIQNSERRLAQGRELVDVLEALNGLRFRPVDLLEALVDCETWGEVLAEKKSDKTKAAAVGRYLKTFRLRSYDRGRTGSTYERAEVIEVIGRHLPTTSEKSATSATSATAPMKPRIVGARDEIADLPLNVQRDIAGRPAGVAVEYRSSSIVGSARESVADRTESLPRESFGDCCVRGSVADVAAAPEPTKQGQDNVEEVW